MTTLPDLTNPTILDLETTVYNRKNSVLNGGIVIGDFAANPFHPMNKIVYTGVLYKNEMITVREVKDRFFPTVIKKNPYEKALNNNFYVGHNIEFDMHYLLNDAKDKEDRRQLLSKLVWDTMVVEYLLSGQSKIMPSLNYCAEKRGGFTKPDIIREYWVNGWETEDIPHKELKEYLEGDLTNTKIVFESQFKEAVEKGMLSLIISNMRALMGLIADSWYGAYFNKQLAEKQKIQIEKDIVDIKATLATIIATHTDVPLSTNWIFNPNSNQHIAAILYGGEISYDDVEFLRDKDGNALVYKTGKKAGQYKTKKIVTTETIKGFSITIKDRTEKGAPSTSDEALNNILKSKHPSLIVQEFIKSILKYRKLSKDINTYYIGYQKLVWPDHMLHAKFNAALTTTGRLSSSKPNLQNLSGDN